MTNIEVKYLLELLAPHNLYERFTNLEEVNEQEFIIYFDKLCDYFEIDKTNNKSFLIILEYLYEDKLSTKESSIYIKGDKVLEIASSSIKSWLYHRGEICEYIKNKCKELCI
jgi:hypothetical protein